MTDGPTKLDNVGGVDSTATAMQDATRPRGVMTLLAPALMEFVGCFIFLYTISLAVALSEIAGLAIGGCLMVLIYMGGHVSGGHFNPAVTLGIFIRDPSFGVLPMLLYMFVQILGGILGAMVAFGVLGEGGYAAKIEPGKDFSSGHAFVNELMFTFLLVSTVLNVATSTAPAYQNNSFFALAIGFSVVAGAIAGGAVSGGAYNPAVAIGVTVGYCMDDGDAKHLYIPIIADFLGGILAGVFYRFIINPHLGASNASA